MSFDSYYEWLGIPPAKQPSVAGKQSSRLSALSLMRQFRDRLDSAFSNRIGRELEKPVKSAGCAGRQEETPFEEGLARGGRCGGAGSTDAASADGRTGAVGDSFPISLPLKRDCFLERPP